MPEREILRTEAFERSLRRLARRYPDLPDTIAQALQRYAIDGPSSMLGSTRRSLGAGAECDATPPFALRLRHTRYR